MNDECDAMHAELSRLNQHNQSLVDVLKEAREQIASLKGEVDRLTRPPEGYGVFLGRFSDGTVDVFTGGRRLRVALTGEIRADRLSRGETVMLNGAFNVVMAVGYPVTGEIWTLREVLPDGRRAVVSSSAEQEVVVYLSDALADIMLRSGDLLLVDVAARYAVERMPGSPLDRLFAPISPVTLDRVGGLAQQIEHLRDAVQVPLQHHIPGVRPARGVLLYGPPGCGKTLLAAAFANTLTQHEGHAVLVRAAELFSKYVGETEHRLRVVFGRVQELAEASMPLVVFFDDIDVILRTRTGNPDNHLSDALIPQFLALLDAAQNLDNVVVLATTSRQDLLDPAAIRPGRLDLKLYVGHPDQQAAQDILALELDADSVAAENLVRPTIEFLYSASEATRLFGVRRPDGTLDHVYYQSLASGAALASIARRARALALRRRTVDGGPYDLTATDLRTAATAEILMSREACPPLDPTACPGLQRIDRAEVDGVESRAH
ncbi:MAG: AAA family ATPase [Catenulispora sp.]